MAKMARASGSGPPESKSDVKRVCRMNVVMAGAATRASPSAGRMKGMVWIPDGTFCMSPDNRYAEEAPAHNVTVPALIAALHLGRFLGANHAIALRSDCAACRSERG